MGRPQLKKSERKTLYLRVRVTVAERLEITRRTKKAGAKSESAWIRQRLLGDE